MARQTIFTTLRAVLAAAAAAALIAPAASTPAFGQEVDDCIDCHMDRNLTRADSSGSAHSLYVDKAAFLKSVHGGDLGYTCVDCHEGAKAGSHPEGGLPDVNCVDCHEEVAAEYDKSAHGKLLRDGSPDAPRCYDCHTMHAVMADTVPQSSTHPDNLRATCGKCHPDEASPFLCELALGFVQGRDDMVNPGLPTAVASVIPVRLKGHGKVNMSEEFSTRRCSDCHFEVIRHGDADLKPHECAGCHTTDRSALVFGKIHKPGVIKDPLMLVLMIGLYAAGIVFLIIFFKGGFGPKKSAGAQPPENSKE